MTREQRTMIAKTVGYLLAISEMENDNEISNALNKTAHALDKMLMDDAKSSPYGMTITCNAEGKVDET